MTSLAYYDYIPRMSAAAATAEPTNPADAQAAPASRLLAALRKVIDYGKDVLARFQAADADNIDPFARFRHFGVLSIRLILARIGRALLLAEALEARLASDPGLLEPLRCFRTPPLPPLPPLGGPALHPRPTLEERERALLARLPTTEEIAAQIRRKPVGAVITDICRDLGIVPGHPLWPDMSAAMIQYGGNSYALVREFTDRVRRIASLPTPAPDADPAPPEHPSLTPTAAATGPP